MNKDLDYYLKMLGVPHSDHNPDRPLLDYISDDLHDKVKGFRNTETLIETPLFKRLFEITQDKDVLHHLIMNGKDKSIRDWMEKNKKILPYDEWTVDMLRSEAKVLQIPNVHHFNKGMLINAVKRRRPQ